MATSKSQFHVAHKRRSTYLETVLFFLGLLQATAFGKFTYTGCGAIGENVY